MAGPLLSSAENIRGLAIAEVEGRSPDVGAAPAPVTRLTPGGLSPAAPGESEIDGLVQEALGFRSEVDAHTEDMLAMQRARALSVIKPGGDAPDIIANDMRTGAALGVPPALVGTDRPYFEQALERRRAEREIRRAPALARWMATDLEGAALARDDIANLAWWERRPPIAAAAERRTQGGLGLETGVTGLKQTLASLGTVAVQGIIKSTDDSLAMLDRIDAGELDGLEGLDLRNALGMQSGAGYSDSVSSVWGRAYLAADDKGRADIRQRIAIQALELSGMQDSLLGAVRAYSEEMQATAGRVPDFTSIEGVNDFHDWLEFNVAQGIPYLLAAGAAGLAGGAAGALGAGYGLGVGDVQSQLIDAGVTDRPDIALAAGVPYAAVELLGPAGRLARGALVSTLREAARSTFRQAGRTIGANFVEEFINEAGQEAIAALAVKAGLGEDMRLSREDMWRLLNAGMAGGFTGATFGVAEAGAGVVARRLRDGEKAAGADGVRARMTEMSEAAKSSMLRKRAPERFMAFLNSVGIDPEQIFIPADALQTYFQGKGIAPEDFLGFMGVDSADWRTALDSGADISIPTRAYATHVAGSEHEGFFTDNVRFDPEGMTASEADEFNARSREAFEEAAAEIEALRQEFEAQRDADEQIFDRVFSELRSAGRSADVAQQEAAVWQSFFRTMAERYGEDALDLSNRFGFRIEGPGNADAPKIGQLEVALETLRRRKSGNASYTVEASEQDAAIADLDEYLASIGIDINTASNEEIAAAMKDADGITFNQPDGEGKRASVSFPATGIESGETVIRLFDGANLSSVLHESGHFFLEAFTALASEADAPPAMAADLAAIREWLGLKDGESYGVDQHEQFARGFEAYLREGKPPSAALRSAFERFRAWLTWLYRAVKDLNVNLTDEVRGVMDRMLATDREIADQTAGLHVRPLFTNAADGGLTDEDFASYRAASERATEAAKTDLLTKAMARLNREKQEWYREERATVEAEVQREVQSQPAYRALEWMGNRRWLGGDAPEGLPDMRVSKRALVERYGDGVLTLLPRGRDTIYAETGGLTMDEVAGWFGFRDGDAMIDAMLNLPKPERVTDKKGKERNKAGWLATAVQAETDARMTRRHGDIMTDGSLHEEAIKTLHGDEVTAFLRMELKALNKVIGAGRITPASIVRAEAREVLASMTVDAASKPAKFLAAERRAGKLAEEAIAAKDFREAARQKRRQIVNRTLYSEAVKLEDEVEKAVKLVKGFSSKAVRAKLAGDYIEQIDALLEQYDFRQVSKKQLRRRNSLRTYVERMKEAGRENELAIDPRIMADTKLRHYKAMPVDEFRGLIDTIRNIDHMGRLKQELRDAKEKRDLEATVDGFVAAYEANIRKREPGLVEGPGEGRRDKARQLLNWVLNADSLLREIDGYENIGAAYQAIKSPIDRAGSALIIEKERAGEAFENLYSVYSKAELRDMSVVRAVNGRSLSKWQIIAMALNTGNDLNLRRLTNPKVKQALSQVELDALLGTLDKRDWDFVQSMWDHIDTYWPQIAEREKRTTGVAPKKVEAREVQTKHGTYRGGYYPIKYDRRISARADDLEVNQIADLSRAGMFGKAATANGHLQERVTDVNMALLLDISVAHGHVNQVIYDLAMSEPVTNAWRVLQHPKTVAAFRNAGRAADHRALEQWLKDTAAGDVASGSFLNKMARTLKSNFTSMKLALNISSALVQPTGLAQSLVVIGKGAVLRGIRMTLPGIGSVTAQDVMAKSVFMRERQTTFHKDIYSVMGDLQSGPLTSRISQAKAVMLPWSFMLMTKTQFYAVDLPSWVGAYDDHLRKNGDEAQAISYADRMVARAQGSGLYADRSAIERGSIVGSVAQSDILKLFTILASYMYAKFNVAYERTDKLASNGAYRDPIQVMHYLVDMTLLFTVEAVAYAAITGGLPDDDETWPEFLAGQTALGVAGTFPFIRDVASSFSGYSDGGGYGAITSAIAQPLIQISQGDLDRGLARGLVNGMGMMTGIPSSQLFRTGDAIFEGASGEDTSPLEYILGPDR